MWIVKEDKIGRLSWKRVKSARSSTPKKRRKSTLKGIKIPFDMLTKLEGAQLKEYINRHLVQELSVIPYLDYTLSWRTDWDFILVQPRDRIRIFRQSLDEQSDQDKRQGFVKKTGPECVQFIPLEAYQRIRTLIVSASPIFINIIESMIQELRAGQQSFQNPNKGAIIELSTEGFPEGHLYFNMTPIPNAPPYVDHRFKSFDSQNVVTNAVP